jgi:hypothetical protein
VTTILGWTTFQNKYNFQNAQQPTFETTQYLEKAFTPLVRKRHVTILINLVEICHVPKHFCNVFKKGKEKSIFVSANFEMIWTFLRFNLGYRVYTRCKPKIIEFVMVNR